jgi:membrane-bound metal-dependent hydrolase YbcI (DUF457 family)
MASYREHLACSSMVGAVYGAAGIWVWNLNDWGPVFLGSGLTALGGVLPDLDSDSGVPIRELFNIAAALTPFLIYPRLVQSGFTLEQALVLIGALYLFIRYGLAGWFKRYTVHRGIFHSIPAMFIAGLVVYLAHASPDQKLRIYLAVGVMLGFLSHLILDELYSVDFMGFRIKLNKFAGSALKLYSPSWSATAACYLLLATLIFLYVLEGHP